VGLACLSETVLLALEGDFNDYSIGVRIPLETIEYLRALGEKHGFGLAALHSGGQEITREEIDAIYKQAQQRQAQTAVPGEPSILESKIHTVLPCCMLEPVAPIAIMMVNILGNCRLFWD